MLEELRVELFWSLLNEILFHLSLDSFLGLHFVNVPHAFIYAFWIDNLDLLYHISYFLFMDNESNYQEEI